MSNNDYDIEEIEDNLIKNTKFLKYQRIVVGSVLVIIAFFNPFLAIMLGLLCIILMQELIFGAEAGMRQDVREALELHRERENKKKANRFNDRFRT